MPMGNSLGRDWRKSKAIHARIDADPPRCPSCMKLVPRPQRYKPNIKYCSDDCRLEAAVERKKQRLREEKVAEKLAEKDMTWEAELEEGGRAGQKFDQIKDWLCSLAEDDAEYHAWLDGTGKSHAAVAKRFGVTAQAVGRYAKHGRNLRLQAAAAAVWEPDEKYRAMLGPSDSEMMTLRDDDPDAYWLKLDELVEAFVDWRDEFFQAGYEAKYITRPMHRKWIFNTLHTIYTGGREMILSPPRHGKSDLLIHFCVWLIIRNPNIRILWVGPNGDIAENCLGAVRDILESDENLQRAFLPRGVHWAPQRRGGGALWQRQKFTVATRSVQLKMPTMWCTGVGGKILSLDCDFIIVDDPADPDDSQTPGGRDKIDKWFKIKLITRKMNHTGVAMISSRVHPDDLYAQFIEKDNWSIHVDRAHDKSVCGRELWDDHDDVPLDDDGHYPCVLFPEVNPLSYLREQHDTVGDALFEMMYLNEPRPDGTMIFDIDQIREMCLDHSRDLGLGEVPDGVMLVAGLDPAARGTQAGFLWAVQMPKEGNPRDSRDRPVEHMGLYVVDIETQKAGGPEGAHRLMREWFDMYGCTLWVVEDNAYQSVFFDDPRTKKLEEELGINIRPTHTGKNKHDPDFGVAGMAPLFHRGHVSLPYGTVAARRKVEQLLRQMSNFTGDTNASGRSRKHESDVLMAGWFPHATVIRKWRRDIRHQQVARPSTASYPSYIAPSFGGSPWSTNYPR